MLETVGQFRLQYNDQAQGTLGSLVSMPSLLSRVIESQRQDTEILSVTPQKYPRIFIIILLYIPGIN